MMDKRVMKQVAIVLSCLFSIVFTGRNNSLFIAEQDRLDAMAS